MRVAWVSGGRAAPQALLGLGVALLGLSCAGVEAPRGSAGQGWSYVFEINQALNTMETTVCFEGRPPSVFVPQVKDARRALVRAAVVDGPALTPAAWGLDLSAVPPDACVRYTLDLEELASSWGWGSRDRRYHDDDLVLTPDVWLWTSDPRPATLPITASFRLPPDIEAVVPWPALPDGRYRVPRTAWKIKAAAAFVRTDVIRFEAAGARVQVARLGEGWQMTPAEVERWVRGAVEANAGLFGGRFPVEDITVLLLPAGGEEVGFGMSTRGGGSAVTLTVGQGLGLGAAERDWTLYHEILHLAFPSLRTEHAWLYEGLVTYYEPILRVRAGLKPSRWAWERLHDGFQRGRSTKTDRTLREESAQMHRIYAFWPVYWGGAAIAFLSDVELRAAHPPGPFASLDAEVQALTACCLRDDLPPWEVSDLLGQLQLPADAPELGGIAARHLDQHDFPDLSDAYRRLGLRFDAEGKLLTQPGDPGAELRIAIMGRDVEPAE